MPLSGTNFIFDRTFIPRATQTICTYCIKSTVMENTFRTFFKELCHFYIRFKINGMDCVCQSNNNN